MTAIEFEPGEVFVYQKGDDHLELGQVKRANDDGTGYFCWYSTGDTAANTPVEHMRKLANAGWSHVERGTCERIHIEGRSFMDGREFTFYKCSECGGLMSETGLYCPSCGREIVG